jgi:hypothetical protein
LAFRTTPAQVPTEKDLWSFQQGSKNLWKTISFVVSRAFAKGMSRRDERNVPISIPKPVSQIKSNVSLRKRSYTSTMAGVDAAARVRIAARFKE